MITNPTPPQWALICGAFQTLAGFALLAFPANTVSGFLRAFPRDVWSGRILSIIAWAFAAWATAIVPIDFLHPIQQSNALIPIAVVLAFLTCWWMPDLLACRAVAGLFMLFPCPLFLALRAHPSDWRLALITYAYALAVWGMFVMFSPFHMRRANFFLADRPLLQKICGAIMLALGLLFIALAFTALR